MKDNGWISVEDRLPEEQERGDNPIAVCNILDGSIFQAFFVDGSFSFGEYDLNNITHWMKLIPPAV